jgi:predicted Rossmann fold nucleotide-binding protein DprA/Smf involved in DNA uptake
LLTQIRAELDQRLAQLRPAVSEYEQLLVAARSLGEPPARGSKGSKDPSGSAKKPARAASSGAPAKRAAAKPARKSAGRGATTVVGQAILDALEHGSHTVAELVMVTAMSAKEIRGGIRRLETHGKVAKVKRDGKTAYTPPS